MATADRRLYLTADRDRVVEEDDPVAAYLYVAAGDDIPDDGPKLPRQKARVKPADKSRRKQADKGAGAGGG